MAAPYSQDLRDRVLIAYDRGEETKAISDSFAVSPAWARRVKQTRRKEGRTTPLPMGGATVVKIDRTLLESLVRARPDATLEELRDYLGVAVSISAIWTALDALGWSYKERRSTRRSRIAPTWPSVGPRGGARSARSTPRA